MNKTGESRKDDKGYWTELFCTDDDRKGGTYICSL